MRTSIRIAAKILGLTEFYGKSLTEILVCAFLIKVSMSWKRQIKIALAIIISLVVVALAVPFFGFFYPILSQMHAGRKYMDSLSDTEIQKWINRSKDYLAHADPNEYPIGARPVPSDLKVLKILRIDLCTNSVVYVWCGGLDHTYLSVNERDGSYEVIARYDDEHSKVIWPK